MENFRTIQSDGTHEIEIKKSRFICHLKRTETEEDAIAFVDAIKKEHWKATHNCSAYLIGERNEIQRAHDDGEPSGTAGVPMLELLKKKDLKNVTTVVTRYFGGVKLGAGGLIRAYGGAVNEAVGAIGIVERQLQQQIALTVSYPLSGKLENHLRESQYLLRDTEYTDKVTFHCLIPVEEVENFKAVTTEWLNGQGEYKEAKKAWIEVPVE
jgi:uncharacterized YigZ family protein